MLPPPTCYLAPVCEGRLIAEPDFRGVFARCPIRAGTLLALWGGDAIDVDRLRELDPDGRRRSLQVDEDLYLVSRVEGPADWINHSCAPNAGMAGQVTLVALRDIQAGEQICYDYAMTDASPYDEFACQCGAAACRGRITGADWALPRLWSLYGPHFSPYILRRIAALSAAQRFSQSGRRSGATTPIRRASRRRVG
jgi:hypothetical protein